MQLLNHWLSDHRCLIGIVVNGGEGGGNAVMQYQWRYKVHWVDWTMQSFVGLMESAFVTSRTTVLLRCIAVAKGLGRVQERWKILMLSIIVKTYSLGSNLSLTRGQVDTSNWTGWWREDVSLTIVTMNPGGNYCTDDSQKDRNGWN